MAGRANVRGGSKLCKCGKLRRKGGRYCDDCNAAATRKYRARTPLSGEARRRSNARAYLHVYIKRGKVQRGPCVNCGNPMAEPHHDDYGKPLEVVWICKEMHLKFHRAAKKGETLVQYLERSCAKCSYVEQ